MYAVEKIFVDILRIIRKIIVRYTVLNYAIWVSFEGFTGALWIALKIIKKVIGTNNESVQTTHTKNNQ